MTKTKAVALLLSVLCALVTYFLLHSEEDEESRLATQSHQTTAVHFPNTRSQLWWFLVHTLWSKIDRSVVIINLKAFFFFSFFFPVFSKLQCLLGGMICAHNEDVDDDDDDDALTDSTYLWLGTRWRKELVAALI
jgi:hypothetical protein